MTPIISKHQTSEFTNIPSRKHDLLQVKIDKHQHGTMHDCSESVF